MERSGYEVGFPMSQVIGQNRAPSRRRSVQRLLAIRPGLTSLVRYISARSSIGSLLTTKQVTGTTFWDQAVDADRFTMILNMKNI